MADGVDYAVSFGQRIRIRCFVEGVEIPAIAATIAAAPNSPSQCSLQVPPLVEGTKLLPRSLIHLFYLDAYETSNPYLLDSATAGKLPGDNTSPTNAENLTGVPQTGAATVIAPPVPCGDTAAKAWQMNRYKLCFVGEVVGFTWTKSPMSRSLLLQCEDLSNYWDYAYQWSNTGIFGPGLKAMFSGGATNLFTDFLSSQGSMLTQIILSGKCNTFPNLEGLSAGIIRLIESIGGSYYVPSNNTKGMKRFAGQNIFFSTAELRLHITQMIMAYEKDPTSKRLLSRGGYGGMFTRTLGGLGDQVSIRQALVALSRVMFHETYPQPCPYYIPGTGTDASGSRRVALLNDDVLKKYAVYAQNCTEQLRQISDTLSIYRTLEASALVEQFPSYKTEIEFYGTTFSTMADTLKKMQSQLKADNAPPIVNTFYVASIKALGIAARNTKNWVRDTPADKLLQKNLDEAINKLGKVESLSVERPNYKERVPPRLVQQIFRPDIWFAAPPRCNVIFPDMYTQMSYQRMYLQEPTRFMLKTNDEFFGEDFLFDKFYFAPQAGSLKKDQARLRDMLRNDILDHELFTGILPVFEKMGEFNVFAARSNREQAGQVVKISYAQRSANFLYFKHRFNARQFQLETRFTPYIAVGFPGVILDKWVNEKAASQIRSMRDAFLAVDPSAREFLLPKYTQELMGTNFLANFAEVTHSLSQQSLVGTTSIRCNYARQVEENAEFFGMENSKEVQRRQEGDAVRTSVVAVVSPPDLYSLGPNQGRIIGRQDVTDKYQVRDIDKFSAKNIKNPGFYETSGMNLPVYFSGARRSGGNKFQQLKVPIGVAVRPQNMPAKDGALLAEFLGGADKEVVFQAYSIDEEVPRYRRETVELPVEEVIRPGWYGDCWSPGKIGEVYQSFFGIGSITEPTVILDGGSTANEDFQKAIAAAQTGEDADQAIADLPLVTSLREGSSISQAVEFLTLTYSYVKQAGLDADEFIRAYTWRPIATMRDLFGSEDLTFDSTGTSATAGTEGFHSRAFGPYEDLFALVTPEIESVVGIQRGTATAQRADTRLRKREAALLFQSALSGGTGQAG